METTNREEATYWLGTVIGAMGVGIFSSLLTFHLSPFLYGLLVSILFLIFGIQKLVNI